jgi:hypothetical protein
MWVAKDRLRGEIFALTIALIKVPGIQPRHLKTVPKRRHLESVPGGIRIKSEILLFICENAKMSIPLTMSTLLWWLLSGSTKIR